MLKRLQTCPRIVQRPKFLYIAHVVLKRMLSSMYQAIKYFCVYPYAIGSGPIDPTLWVGLSPGGQQQADPAWEHYET